MILSEDLIREFAKVTNDEKVDIKDTVCYGAATFSNGNSYVILDGSDELTPATFTVKAKEGDRVMISIRNRRAVVTANITNPSLLLGELQVDDFILVKGYLTTNEDRKRYNDTSVTGLTFSSDGIGAYGGSGHYWYMTATGDLYAENVELVGKITATSGFIGTKDKGFYIDESGFYSGDKSGISSGDITFSNTDFTRNIGGVYSVSDLRLAIGKNFGVTKSGKLYATDINVTGVITATSGYIGTAEYGFTIDENGFYAGAKSGSANGDIQFSTKSFNRIIGNTSRSNLRLAIGSKFGVDGNGVIYGEGAVLSGTLTAGAGSKIGPWTVSEYAISYGEGGFGAGSSLYFGTEGISLGTKFSVTNEGVLKAEDAEISGEFTVKGGSKIGPWNISDTSIWYGSNNWATTGSLYFGTRGLSVNDKFFVDDKGKLTSVDGEFTGKITAKSGVLGGWLISEDYQIEYRDEMTEGVDGTQYNVFVRANQSATSKATLSTMHFGVRHREYKNSAYGAWVYDFYVNHAGELHATKGVLGPWNLTNTSIWYGNKEYGNASGLYFGTDGFSVKNRFRVNANGYLTASGVEITGKITAESGVIAGWRIDKDYQIIHVDPVTAGTASTQYIVFMRANDENSTSASSTTKHFGLQHRSYNGSSYGPWIDDFYVNHAGTLYSRSANITGTINADSGSIGAFNINSNGLYYGSYIKVTPTEIYLSATTTKNVRAISIYSSSSYEYLAFRGKNTSDTLVIGQVNWDDIGNLGTGANPTTWTISSNQELVIDTVSELVMSGFSGIDISSDNGRVSLSSSAAGVIIPTTSCFRPTSNSDVNLGTNDHKWLKVYAKDGISDGSDRKLKDNIESMSFAKEFILSLTPVTYMWKDGDHRRTRMGFIAQDIAKICKDLNKNLALVSASYVGDSDQALDYLGEEVDDSKLTWSLRYTELIAPIVQVIQDQQKEIDELKIKLSSLTAA